MKLPLHTLACLFLSLQLLQAGQSNQVVIHGSTYRYIAEAGADGIAIYPPTSAGRHVGSSPPPGGAIDLRGACHWKVLSVERSEVPLTGEIRVHVTWIIHERRVSNSSSVGYGIGLSAPGVTASANTVLTGGSVSGLTNRPSPNEYGDSWAKVRPHSVGPVLHPQPNPDIDPLGLYIREEGGFRWLTPNQIASQNAYFWIDPVNSIVF